jgi:hypothetical protein
MDITCSPNLLNDEEKCVLQSTRREQYYKHTYDPSSTVKNVQSNVKYGKGMYSKIEEVFDLTRRENCCNCISISLYLLGNAGIPKYLESIWRSVRNVNRCLPDWLVRVYMDTSVYEVIRKAKSTEGMELLNKIEGAENVEVYTYICKSIYTKETKIERTRTFRFIPFRQEDVNVSIIREADGIVTYLDCHNIRVFENSNKILYVVPFGADSIHINSFYPLDSYSKWLQYYKSVIEVDYFTKKNNLYDLLAGLIGIKLKVKSSTYDKYSNSVQAKIDNAVKKGLKFAMSGAPPHYEDLIEEIYKSKHGIEGTINTGFDEILLLELFRDIISCEYDIAPAFGDIIPMHVDYSDQSCVDYVMSLILGERTLKKYHLENEDKDSILKLVSKLAEDKILKRLDLKAKLEVFDKSTFDLNTSSNLLKALLFIDSLLLPENFTEDGANIALDIECQNCNYFKQAFTKEVTESTIKLPNTVLLLGNYPYNLMRDLGEQQYSESQDGGGADYYAKYVKYKSKYIRLKGTLLSR